MADVTSVAEHYLEVHGKLYSHWSNRNDRGRGKGQGQTPSSSKSQFQGKVKGSEYRPQTPKASGKSCFLCSSTSHPAYCSIPRCDGSDGNHDASQNDASNDDNGDDSLSQPPALGQPPAQESCTLNVEAEIKWPPVCRGQVQINFWMKIVVF